MVYSCLREAYCFFPSSLGLEFESGVMGLKEIGSQSNILRTSRGAAAKGCVRRVGPGSARINIELYYKHICFNMLFTILLSPLLD